MSVNTNTLQSIKVQRISELWPYINETSISHSLPTRTQKILLRNGGRKIIRAGDWEITVK